MQSRKQVSTKKRFYSKKNGFSTKRYWRNVFVQAYINSVGKFAGTGKLIKLIGAYLLKQNVENSYITRSPGFNIPRCLLRKRAVTGVDVTGRV